ncbi:LPXTG-domain-containing protein cell wall anchor domain [Enterococcus pallens]|nr:LPXTG-domain-containing protein cell wall anchor domain [Enterococcus pallens]
MERHEEKIRATIRRNKRLITLTTLVGLVCPATLGTIQALADETAPTTEQTAEPVTEPVAEPVTETQPTEAITPEQTTNTLSQEPVTPEAEVIESEQPVTTEETQPVVSTETVQAQAPVNNVAQAQAVTPLSNPTVVAEYRTKLAGYQAQASQLVADGATADQMTTINALLSAFEININNYENDIGDVPAVWLADIDHGIVPALEDEIQRVKDELANNPGEVSVTGVTISSMPEMAVGKTYQLTVTVMPENATNKNVTFTSSNPSVATVDANGLVTGVAEGEFTITATTADGGFTASSHGVVYPDDDIPMKDFDYTAVLAAIARYDAMVENEYTPESWKAMEAEMINNDSKLHLIDYLRQLPEAEGTVPSGYANQFQTDLNAYAAKAQSIMDLAIKKDVTPPKDVDKSGLEEAIKNGDDKITEGGWKDTGDLETALEDGKKVLNDDKATQAQVNEAVKNINDAIDALAKKDDGNNGGNGNDNNGNDNGSNSSNGANGGTGNSSNKTNTTNLNNQSKQTSNAGNSNKDNLPLTGDSTTNGLLAGLSMVGLSLVALVKRKRKA